MPRLGEEEKRTVIPRLRVTASWDGFSAPRRKRTALWSPQDPGWVIIETEVVVHTSNNGERAVSLLAGGLDLVTDQELKEVSETAIEYTAGLTDEEKRQQLDAKIKEKLDNYYHEVEKYKSNKNVIHAVVSAKPHGSFIDRKRGWEEISVKARLRFVGGDAKDVLDEIEEDLGVDLGAREPGGD